MDNYVFKNNKELRIGYTTGTCATAASKAATMMLLSGKKVEKLQIDTLKGITFDIEILNIEMSNNQVKCAVRKDGGDDPDVTHGLLIYSCVSKNDLNEIIIDGGEGIGRVTKKGLDQEVGNAAINSTPRKTIKDEVLKVCETYGYQGGMNVIISAPGGEEIAKRTFNPKLGIIGGISIIGTSGIVNPMSEEAILDTLKTEMRMLVASGYKNIIITPGNYGETYVNDVLNIHTNNIIKCSNFIGDTIEYANHLGFENILLVGHIGKMIKLSGGIMNTHSKYGECRAELFSCFGAMHGLSKDSVNLVMQSAMSDDMLDIIDKENLKEIVMQEVLNRIEYYLNTKAHNEKNLKVIVFSNKQGLLAQSENIEEFIKNFEE